MMAPLAADVIYAKEWLARFRSLFDQEAADPRTALGLFYERHRRFVPVAGAVAPSRPEYTYEEWNRTFTAFLASLARDFGLVQTASWSDVPQLMWLWHGLPDRPAVAIREVKVAGEAIVREEVPSVVKSGALLTVLVVYPDFPSPEGVGSVEEATEHWRRRVAEELANLGVTREFLLATISAFDWEIPAPWKGFAWRPSDRSMAPVQ
ncbi:MAG TPA: hypothetical protein VEJ85_02920 [Thermoplasmata archaeon]|nr:hypothetical protein [Thermoplasmata archaeon]